MFPLLDIKPRKFYNTLISPITNPMAGSKKTIKHTPPSHRLLASSQDVTDDEEWTDAPARDKPSGEEPDHDAVLSGDETFHTNDDDDYSDDDDATTDKAIVPMNPNDEPELKEIHVRKRKIKPSTKVSVLPSFTFAGSFGFPAFPANPHISLYSSILHLHLQRKGLRPSPLKTMTPRVKRLVQSGLALPV